MVTISEGIFHPSVPDLFALRQRITGANNDGRLYLEWKHPESWGGSFSPSTSTTAIYFYYLGF